MEKIISFCCKIKNQALERVVSVQYIWNNFLQKTSRELNSWSLIFWKITRSAAPVITLEFPNLSVITNTLSALKRSMQKFQYTNQTCGICFRYRRQSRQNSSGTAAIATFLTHIAKNWRKWQSLLRKRYPSLPEFFLCSEQQLYLIILISSFL